MVEQRRSDDVVPHHRVAIIGSGFSGLGAAIRLRQEGFDDFAVLEKGADVGGTWRDNTYPGCACDVPSHLYSFSFALNPDWPRSFSRQAEIWEYLRRCATDHGVLERIRFGQELLAAAWQPDRQRWRIETTSGMLTADVLVSGAGALHEPTMPKLAGQETFEGTAFHSAQWRHDHDLNGRTVAVIGTGASAIQFVPEIAPQTDRLLVFQRTPPWIVPRMDRRLTKIERLAYRRIPGLQRAVRAALYWRRELIVGGFRNPKGLRQAERLARWRLRRQVRDPRLRARLVPNYRMGCKRILLSNDYLPALNRDNVDVVTDAITELTRRGVRTADGTLHEVDTIIYGTGFRVADLPIAHRVRAGDGRTLAEHWEGTATAHVGTTVHGFPNLFLLLGPNTGLGHNSVVFMIEAQIEHLISAMRYLRDRRIRAIEPRRAAQEAYNARLQEQMRDTVWVAGGCASWYLDANGRNSTLWPTYTMPFKQRVERLDPAEYQPVSGQ